MPIPIPTAIEENAAPAADKAAAVARLPRYLLSSALAGAYVGIAVVAAAVGQRAARRRRVPARPSSCRARCSASP